MPAKVTIVAGSPPRVTVVPPEVPRVRIVTAKQGPPGARGLMGLPGPAGDDPKIIAAATVSGHRVIATNGAGEGIYADQSNNTTLAIQGVGRNAAGPGEEITLARAGKLDYPAGGLTPGQPIFLGTTGFLTQTPPTSGWLRQIGFAVEADIISIDIGPAFWLGV